MNADGDFASAAMVRVLSRGMAALGLHVPPSTGDASHDRPARIGLDRKRALVEAAVGQAGLACLPRLGAGLRGQHDDPTHRALASAADGIDLLERWRRLERYVHSVHRTEIVASRIGDDGSHAELRHVATRAGRAPAAAEDLVVIGVLAALLEEIGAGAVGATIDDVPVWPHADEAALRALARDARTGRWTLRWTPPRPGPAPGAAPHRSADMRPDDDAPHDPSPDALAVRASMPWPAIAHRCAAWLLADPLRPHRLAHAAAALGTSPRSLQRALGEAGLTFSTVLGEARVRAAAWRLIETREPIVVVGFASGYADQPHFTRDFSRRTGVPPGRYREHFARAPGQPPDQSTTPVHAVSSTTHPNTIRYQANGTKSCRDT